MDLKMKNVHINFTLLLISGVGFLFAMTLNPRNRIVSGESENKKYVILHASDDTGGGFPGNESALVYEPAPQAHHETSSAGQHSQVGEIHSKNRRKPTKVKQITYRFVARQKFTAGGRKGNRKVLHDIVVRNEKSVESLSSGEYVIAKSEALQQVNSGLDSSVPKMVVTTATAVVALFGMCVMAAIFQCCCRKKRSTNEGEADDAKSEKSSESRRSKSPSPVKQKLVDSDGLSDDKSEADKLLVDDELGDFSMVQRETEILKSYRKPPPPKNRARATRSPKIRAARSEDHSSLPAVIDEESVGETSSRQGSQRTTPEKNTETEDRNETNKQSESTDGEKVSFSAAQTHLENVLSEVKGQVTDNTDDSKTVNGQTTPSLERKSSLEKRNTNTEKSGASSKLCDAHTNGANIFLQIDPTVKRKENAGSQNTSKIPVKQSVSAPTDEAKRRPPSDHKDQRKFIVPSVHGDQMDQLVKSLKSKMKEDTSQSARNLSINKVVATAEDEEVKPVSRERCYTDPTKQNAQALKPTHV